MSFLNQQTEIMTFCSAPNTEERGHRSPSISVHDKCNAFSLLPANNNNAQYHLRSWDEQIKCSHQRHGTNGRCLAVASDARAKARQQLLPPQWEVIEKHDTTISIMRRRNFFCLVGQQLYRHAA
mmetsp:Transcript_26991/g.57824  ORF Transcript_26991/g.57824 Transcript_26991/m.57824 type:complete len:124 (+) Transcript_26991:517-888(+)